MQLRSGLKTSSSESRLTPHKTRLQSRLKSQKFKPEASEIVTKSKALHDIPLLNIISKYIDMMEEHKRKNNQATYWSNYGRLLIEFYAIINEHYEYMSQEGSAWSSFLQRVADDAHGIKRSFLNAVENVDFERNDEILINNLIYDLNNLIARIESDFPEY